MYSPGVFLLEEYTGPYQKGNERHAIMNTNDTKNRTESDSFGPIEVATERLWGAQTQRSLAHFHISSERMAPELIAALALTKLWIHCSSGGTSVAGSCHRPRLGGPGRRGGYPPFPSELLPESDGGGPAGCGGHTGLRWCGCL